MQTVEHFFQTYAKAYINSELDTLGQLISLPSLLLASESKTLLTDIDSLHRHVLGQVAKYRALGVVTADFVLQHQLRLSDQLQFVSLYWRFYDDNNKVMFTCHTSYTLQAWQGSWQVVSIITDDEQAAYDRVVKSQA
ncbi:hypothetical protein [Rheinheimera sp. NSM]|uniref:hypothetical protein n=1 Tax=Rheinheimera sp. NSM TaxID=3457884 RepID=UPI0040359A18